jgi:hypothetical protein
VAAGVAIDRAVLWRTLDRLYAKVAPVRLEALRSETARADAAEAQVERERRQRDFARAMLAAQQNAPRDGDLTGYVEWAEQTMRAAQEWSDVLLTLRQGEQHLAALSLDPRGLRREELADDLSCRRELVDALVVPDGLLWP